MANIFHSMHGISRSFVGVEAIYSTRRENLTKKLNLLPG